MAGMSDLYEQEQENKRMTALEDAAMRADSEIPYLTYLVETLRDALQEIANGEGHYGAQAYEYKQIARKALKALEVN